MTNALALHGETKELDSLAGRFKIALRGGDKLSIAEARALAQISLVTGLDPYIGEIWYIPGKGPMIGIAGARKQWNKQSKEGGGFSFVDIVPCSPEEAGATEPDVVAAFKAIAHDSKATKEYQKLLAETLAMLRESKVDDPFPAAKEIVGPKPQWIGYGYSTKSEQSRMNKMQLARKRAEADALKKCIIVPFGVDVSIEERTPEYVDAQFADTPPTMSYDEAKNTTVKTSRGDKFIGELSAEELQKVIEKSTTPEFVQAAQIVLKQDYQMEGAA